MKRFILITLCSWLLAMLMCLPVGAQARRADAGGAPSASLADGSAVAVVDSNYVISLLTCSPGQQVYELYGHTALRVRNVARNFDYVFNYGAFSFEQPHFIARFVLGRCDYMAIAQTLQGFLADYARRGSSVTEQVLNLTPAEAQALADDLVENIRPENSQYRYNIFRNNCTLKAREMIESHVNGQVRYVAHAPRNSIRTILHEYTREHLWDREGNDLLLGVSVDTAIYERDEMFAPEYFMHYADSAFIDAGIYGMRPLVLATSELLPPNTERAAAAETELPSVPFSPRALWWSLLVAGLLLGCYEVVRCRVVWPVDAVLMTLQGLAGVLLVFMSLFSEHPGVASNWQVWVLNPLPLFFIPFVAQADIRRQRSVYHRFACVWLTLFLVLYVVLPQHFSQLILPLALLLLSRAVVHLIIEKKRSRR